MRRALVVALVLVAARAIAFEPPPAPTGAVSDFAGALTPDARERLERQITSYTTGNTHQIAVAIFRSLDGDPIEDASMRLAERWKIGSKQDDGVLLTVFVADRQLRIEVGYGVEDRLPDARAAQILRERIIPRFRAGDLEGGLRAGVAAIDTAITGRAHDPDAAAPTSPVAHDHADHDYTWIVFLIVIGFVVLFSRRGGIFFGPWFWGGRGRGGSSPTGGGFSGGGGHFGGGGASGRW